MPVTDSPPGETPDSVVYQIVTELEEHGLDWHDYRLNDTLNPDALEDLIASANSAIQVSFEIQNFWVTVSGDGGVDVVSS